MTTETEYYVDEMNAQQKWTKEQYNKVRETVDSVEQLMPSGQLISRQALAIVAYMALKELNDD